MIIPTDRRIGVAASRALDVQAGIVGDVVADADRKIPADADVLGEVVIIAINVQAVCARHAPAGKG